ncbi:MAG: hypothetical protein L0191_07265 [Acidobacteria bacterium]|nr:hypothetical protein [Acidobacteriota bacterium]
MPGREQCETHERDAVTIRKHHQKNSSIAFVAMIFLAPALSGLTSCAGFEVQPESAVIMAPADEVWNVTLELLREREYKISRQDNSKHELQATKDIVLRVITDRSTPRDATDKEHHQLDLRVRPRGDDRSVVEVVYRIEKLVIEDAAFRLIGTVRDRVATRSSGPALVPPRRR